MTIVIKAPRWIYLEYKHKLFAEVFGNFFKVTHVAEVAGRLEEEAANQRHSLSSWVRSESAETEDELPPIFILTGGVGPSSDVMVIRGLPRAAKIDVDVAECRRLPTLTGLVPRALVDTGLQTCRLNRIKGNFILKMKFNIPMLLFWDEFSQSK